MGYLQDYFGDGTQTADANKRALANDPDVYMFGAKANSNYLARIFQVQGGSTGAQGALIARGYLPETFNIGVSSEWSEPFASISAGALGDAVQLLTNRKLVTQAMTMQMWQGTAPIRFNMRFHFVAYSDAYQDVVSPVESLIRLTVPFRATGGVLVPPGPDVQWLQGIGNQLDAQNVQSAYNLRFGSGQANTNSSNGTSPKVINTAKGKISVAIGNFLYFDNVVVENVDAEFDTAFTSAGLPISARVDVTFKTFTILTQDAQNDNGTSNGVDDDITALFNPPQLQQNGRQ